MSRPLDLGLHERAVLDRAPPRVIFASLLPSAVRQAGMVTF